MLCADPDVHLWITRRNAIDLADHFVALARQLDGLPREGAEVGVPVAPFESYHQALWRLAPDTYFAYALTPPLVELPLLCFCHPCGWAIEGSHVCLTPSSLTDRPLVSAA
jgi:hypothetical protein